MSSTPGYAKRYELDRALGRNRTPVPAGPVQAHVLSLLGDGLTATAIARVVGVSHTAVRDIAVGRTLTVRWPIAEQIMRTTVPVAVAAVRGPLQEVPAMGTIRRVQALLALGHTHGTITQASGCSSSARLTGASPPVRVTRAVADAVDRAFRGLGMRPGRSSRTRARAVAAGYVPPLAWDDIDADTEPAVPNVLVSTVDEVEWLAAAGETLGGAAVRLGYKDAKVLERTLYRARRYDLVTRMRQGVAA